MVRKMCLALMALLLLLPASALAEARVIDEIGSIDGETERQIIQIIEQVEREHQVDLVVLVTDDVPTDKSDSMWRVEEYAQEYSDRIGCGMGPDDSGLLYLIDVHNRVQWIDTVGVMEDYFTSSREDELLDAAEPYLKRNDWGNAALAVVRQTAELLDEGRERGILLYDKETGARQAGLGNPLELLEVLLAAGGGVAVAFVMYKTVSSAYGLKGSTYSYDLHANGSSELTRDEEQFLHQTVTRTARSKSSGGHSGGGFRSSGGRSHGGGGRRF